MKCIKWCNSQGLGGERNRTLYSTHAVDHHWTQRTTLSRRQSFSSYRHSGGSALHGWTCSKSGSETRRVCRSVASTLSGYAFPGTRPDVCRWFEEAVRDIVKNIHNRCFLQLVRTLPQLSFQQYTQAGCGESLSQLWDAFSQSTSIGNTELAILVHPLQNPEDYCIVNKLGETDQSRVDHQSGGGRVRCQDGRSIVEEEDGMSGRLGDCCDGEGSADLASMSLSVPPVITSRMSSSAEYFGLVVQSRYRSSVAGCYVLKLVRNQDSCGCSCSHYSVSKVCAGVPLGLQLKESWLAS